MMGVDELRKQTERENLKKRKRKRTGKRRRIKSVSEKERNCFRFEEL